MNERAAELSSVLRETVETLARIRGELHSALDHDVALLGKTNRAALIVAGLLENYYRCLETAFVRISQFFENNLGPEKWHRELLGKMQMEIEGVRIAAVSKSNAARLAELLRFRHFRRYYFEIDYDWRKLEYLAVILSEAHPIVEQDFARFDAFVRSL